MKRFERESRVGLQLGIALSLAGVLLLDVLTPIGIVVWVLYLVPVTLSVFLSRPAAPLLAAGCGSALTLAGIWLSPVNLHFPVEVARLNRGIGALALWVVALIVRQAVLTRLRVREQDWVRSGERDLGLRTQGERRVEVLADGVLRFLCEYLDAAAGVLYVKDTDGRFSLRASWALAEDAHVPESLAPGVGLLGQALKEGRPLRLDEVPEGYLPLASALLRARPRHLVAVPASADGEVVAGIELAFAHEVGISDMDLLATTAEPIAVSLRAAQYRAQLEELLAQTQQQAEQLQAQQEELRVSNEELEEQSRALRESQARLEAQHAELEQTNVQLEEQASLLEQQRDALARAQRELVERAEQLERSNQYKSEFLANMSHELRTPLNSALILARLLADNKDGNLTPEQVRYAGTIHGAGNDLLELINDILDLSRIEAGRMSVQPEPVRLSRVAEEAARTFRPVAEQRRLALVASVAPGTAEAIVTDPLRLQQILRNLLSNALKFTERGDVSLAVSQPDPAHVAFAVRDTGIGIAADQQETIFEAFRQADGSSHRKYGGSGLGLTISRELARRLGGELAVESAPGAGSTFTLTLPLALTGGEAAAEAREAEPLGAAPPAKLISRRRPEARPLASAADGAAAAAAPGVVEDDRARLAPGRRRILVIEDDQVFAGIVRDLVRDAGYDCLVASRAAEGLELAQRHTPNGILLDVHLPDGSGLGVLEQLKGDPRTRHLPVHVLSVGEYAQQALELGAVGFAVKPVRREQLESALLRLEERLDQKLRRVLVVEDVAAQRESVVALLRSENVEIVPVASGREALEQLGAATFDCLVLDLQLPDMSGFDLLDRMAASEAFSFPPVVVYTGRALSRDEEQRLRRYASSIIVKGARSPERLLDEVTLFLHQVEATLPQEQQRMLREVRSREAGLEGKRVLVVEDDVRNVFALTSLLEPRGAAVKVARNGLEALAALEQAAARGERCDLVLMDVMMPEMDGLAATREIRRRREWQGLPIIALTAKAMPDDRERCLAAGADDYIAKPLDVDRLLSLVKVWVAR